MWAERLAQVIRRFHRPLLAVWLVGLVAAGLAAPTLADRLSGGGWYVPGSQSKQAAELLQTGFADRGSANLTLVVRDQRHRSGEPAFDRRVGGVVRDVAGDRRLRVSGSYGWADVPEGERGRFTGTDGRTAITLLGLRLSDGTARRVLPDVQQEIADRYAPRQLRVALVGPSAFWGEVNQQSEEKLQLAELITLPLILLILLLLFRGVAAAAVSFVVGSTAIVFTLGVLAVVARHVELSVFVQNAATMIGFGVGVDYSLFIISRYTEELSRGRERLEALATTLRTSGETVVFSGMIVILSMATLFLVDLNVIQSIALGIVVVVAFAVLASVLVLPPLLYLLGHRVMWGRLPGRRGEHRPAAGRWQRVTRQIMRRPVLYLVVASTAMLALAAPALGLRTFTPDARIVPQSAPVRWGYDTIREEFGQGTASPLQVVIRSGAPLDASPGAPHVLRLHDRLAALPHVTRVDSAVDVLRAASPQRPFAALAPAASPRLPAEAGRAVDRFVSADRRTLVFEVIADDYAASEHARALLDAVRAEAGDLHASGLRVVVGGETAEGVDANAVIRDGLPAVVLTMLVVIYLLLLVTFRSLLLPLKAIVMNLLSVGATYGVLVLVFQHGWGAGLVGEQQVGHLQNFVPVLLLAILFSLSTDYEVFLLGRIREEYDAGADNTTSVATGTARTAPLISGAAVLMIAVFGAFAFTSILPIKQLGLGLALAIALDATVIRLIVVPAAMQLMGRWNWWLPGRPGRRALSAPPPTGPVPRPAAAARHDHDEAARDKTDKTERTPGP